MFSPPRIHCWELPSAWARDGLASLAPSGWTLRLGKADCGGWQLADDFDWGLWSNRRVLLHGSCEAHLLDRTHVRLVLSPPPELPFAAGDLPDGPFRAALQRLTLRPLLSRTEIACQRRDVALANAIGKIVARGRLEEWSLPDGTPVIHGLVLAALRGYREEFSQLVADLASTPLAPLPASPLLVALERGRVPAFQPDVPCIALHFRADLSPAAAVQDLLRKLLANTWRNAAGVLADLDPECLHHCRVNLRRARAVASQAEPVIGKPATRRFVAHLRAIAGHTGALRDLDIQLANRTWYESLVPPEQATGLAGFMTHLAQSRRRELRSLRQYLRSPRHRHHRERLEHLLKGIASPRKPHPLAKLLAKCVHRRFCRLAKAARGLGDHPSDTDLHRLRIAAKKLRYPFESARSIFPAELIAQWVPGLKQLQDALGRAHDLLVCVGRVNGYIAAQAAAGLGDETEVLERLVSALRHQLAIARETALEQLRVFLEQHQEQELLTQLGMGKRKP